MKPTSWAVVKLKTVDTEKNREGEKYINNNDRL